MSISNGERESTSSSILVHYDSTPGTCDQNVAKEVAAGQVIGPLVQDKDQEHVSYNFMFIPKAHKPYKWWLIVDLSYPEGASVYNSIEASLCSLTLYQCGRSG